MSTLKNTDAFKGSKLNLFVKTASGVYDTIGMSTNHSLSVTLETTDLATKDHGDYPAVMPQNITWEITADNVYTQESNQKLEEMLMEKKEIDVVYSQVDNYQADEHGIIDNEKEWSYGNSLTGPQIIAAGKALITNYNVTAQQGDYAQISVTLRGSGELKPKAGE